MHMMMKNQPHPGEHIRHDYLRPLQLTITDAAIALSVTRQTVTNLVNGRSGVSPEMAIRLSKAFGGGHEIWLAMQMQYNLARAERNARHIKVRRVKAA